MERKEMNFEDLAISECKGDVTYRLCVFVFLNDLHSVKLRLIQEYTKYEMKETWALLSEGETAKTLSYSEFRTLLNDRFTRYNDAEKRLRKLILKIRKMK